MIFKVQMYSWSSFRSIVLRIKSTKNDIMVDIYTTKHNMQIYSKYYVI